MPKVAAVIQLQEVVRRIANRHHNLARFWSNATGWAPESAAEMLSKARLDRLESLACSLIHWVEGPTDLSDGDLILAWANLGALVDGALKLFLSVYLRDFKADHENGLGTGAFHIKKQMMLDPDGLRLDVLISYFEESKLLDQNQVGFVRLVQKRRNLIHAFKDGDLGSKTEFTRAVLDYRDLIADLSLRLPYPDDIYGPTESGPH